MTTKIKTFFSVFMTALTLLTRTSFAEVPKETVVTSFQSPSSAINFTHLTIDPISGIIYIGAVNHIYQLDSNLSLIHDAITGPVRDSPLCSASTCDGIDESLIKSTKNINKILVIDPSNRKLISCGSVHQGSCRRHELNDITAVEPIVSNPIAANDENSSTVAFVSLAKYSSKVTEVLYVGTSNTRLGPYRDLLPAISSRSLDPNSLFSIIEHSFSDSARVDISYHYRDTFLVKYVKGFHSNNFIYFVTNQKISPLRESEDLGVVSRLSRICDTDAGYHTYTEVTIACIGSDGHKYDLISDSIVTRVTSELSSWMSIAEGDEVLIATFNTYKGGDHMKTSSSGSPSAICAFPMKEIESMFNLNIHNCYNGSQETRNMDYIAGNIQKCPEIGKSGNVVSFCSETLKINGSIPILGVPIKTYGNSNSAKFNGNNQNFDKNNQENNLNNDEILTSVLSVNQGRSTHIIVGTSKGHVKKLLIKKSANYIEANEYEDVIIDEGSYIMQDMVTDRRQQFIYVSSPYKVVKLPLSSSSSGDNIFLNHFSSDQRAASPTAKDDLNIEKYELIRRMTTSTTSTTKSPLNRGSSSNYKPNLPSTSYNHNNNQQTMIPRRRQPQRASSAATTETPVKESAKETNNNRYVYQTPGNQQQTPTLASSTKDHQNHHLIRKVEKDVQAKDVNEKLTFIDTIPWIIFVMLLGVITTITLIHRRSINLWIYTKYGLRLTSCHEETTPKEGDKLFDAFLSYSLADEGFVQQILSPELEYGPQQYRLCCHYRDLPFVSSSSTTPSGCYLGDAIVEAMEASKRCVLIISDSYLKSEWCKFDFKSAHLEVIRRLATEKERKKLILIFLGTVSPEDIDPDIRGWIKHCTTLQWGEKMFWDKLRYALPKISSTNGPYNSNNSSSSSGGGSFITSGSFTRKKLHPSTNANYTSVTTIDRHLLGQTPKVASLLSSPTPTSFNCQQTMFNTKKLAPNSTLIHNLNTPTAVTPGYKNFNSRGPSSTIINSQTLRQTLNKSAGISTLIPSSASSSSASSAATNYGPSPQINYNHYNLNQRQSNLNNHPHAQSHLTSNHLHQNSMMITSLDGLDL